MNRQKTTGEMSEADLAQVLSQVRAGDSDAWGELYRRYAPAIFRFCRRVLPAREDAEDATTEIFMKVRQKLGTYDATRPFTAWLYKVASNHCWDTLRRRHIRQDLETGDLENLPLEHPDPSQLERLQAEVNGGGAGRAREGRDVQRIGLSATQSPLEEIGRFLVGPRRDVRIIDAGARTLKGTPPEGAQAGKQLDLRIEVPVEIGRASCRERVWIPV